MKFLVLILLLWIPGLLSGQELLDQYVQEGLANNLALKQKELNYEKSLEALKEAKSLFFPNISLNARYSVSEGGRTIDLPIGDLLNPVYASLNQLLQQNAFPQIENLSFLFLRPFEQETKLRLIQPIFSSDLHFNQAIRKELVQTEKVSLEQYQMELTAEIKKAWYQVARAEALVRMLHQSRILLEENVRVNDRLVANDKLTLDHLYRSQTELSKFDQQITEAEKNKTLAAAYLNFLVNRPLQQAVLLSVPVQLPVIPESPLELQGLAQNNRLEIKQLEGLARAADYQLRMNKAKALPEIFLVADYGLQGEKYRFNRDADFTQASALLSWDLFHGFNKRARVRQSLIQKEILEIKKEETRHLVDLQVLQAHQELVSDLQMLESAKAQLKSAREGFRLTQRRYEEGMASLIEFIDARASLTQAEENEISTRFKYLSDFAELEKVSALKNL